MTFLSRFSLALPISSRARQARLRLVFALTCSLSLVLLVKPIVAATWTNTASGGLWTTAGNWAGGVPNATDAIADFSTLNITADNTVHLNASETVGSLLFGDTVPSNNWILDNNGNAANILTLSASSGSPTIFVNNQTATIGAVLAGTQGLAKTGGGTLIFTGAETYSGTTTINGGTLQIGNGLTGSLNSSSAVTFSGTATLNFFETIASSQSLGALAFSAGDDTLKSTFNATSAAVTFSSLAPRVRGATGNFVYTVAPSSTNKIVLTGKTLNSFIDPGLFFDGGTSLATFAWYDSGGFVRGLTYTETNAQNVTAVVSAFAASTLFGEVSGASGAITGQTTATMTTLQIANANSFTIAGGNTLTVSGILKSGNAAGGSIQTGNLRGPSGGDLVIRTDQASDTLTIGSLIVDNNASGLTKSGPGTLSLTAANTYTGGTIVNSGIVAVAYSVNDGKSTLGGSSLTINNGAVVRIDANNALGFGGAEPPTTINSGGLMTSSAGVNQHLSTLTLSGGTLSSPAASGTAITFGTYDLDNNLTAGGTTNTSTISAQSFALTTTGGTTFTVNPGAANGIDLDVSGTIGAPGGVSNTGLIKAGSGVMRLSGTNSFTAGTTINNGTLTISSDANLGSIGGSLTFGGGTLQTTATFGVAATRTVTFNAAGTFNTDPSTTLTISQVVGGVGGLTKIGLGALTLSGGSANTFGGPVNVNNGTLMLSKSSGTAAFGSTTLNIGDGLGATNSAVVTISNINNLPQASFANVAIQGDGLFNPNSEKIANLTMSGGAVSISTFLSINGDLTTLASSATATISGTVLEVGLGATRTFTIAQGTTASGIDLDVPAFIDRSDFPIVKAGPGAMRLSGNNGPLFAGGLTLTAGSLLIGNDGALGAQILTLNGGVVQADGGSHTINNAVSIVQDSTIGGANDFTIGGAVSVTGSRTLTVSNGGVTTLSGGIALGGNTLTIGGSGNTTLSGVTSGNGGLTKSGLGTLTLTNTNTFVGGVTVNAGTLVLTNSNTFTGGLTINGGTLQAANASGSATGAGVVAVNSGGKLAGPSGPGLGFIGGPVTVAGGGSIVGTSGGTLTFNGGLTLQAGSSSTFTLGAPNGTANPLINVTNSGGLAASGAHTINLSGAPAIGTYNLYSYTGPAPTFSNFNLGTTGLSASLVNNTADHQIDLVITNLLTWTGQNGGSGASNTTWNTSATNWANGSTPVAYANGNAVTFQDINTVTGGKVLTMPGTGALASALIENVTINPAGVTPSNVTFNNTLNSAAISAYVFTNAGANGIGGSTGVTIQGGGIVIFSNANTYTGTTTIINGVLIVGDTITTGSLSSNSALTLGSVSGGTGEFEFAPGPAGATQSLGALTVLSGDAQAVTGNTGGTVSLTFSSLAPRPRGSTLTFSLSGGVNGVTNQIVLTGQPAGFINQGTFVDNEYAWMNGPGTFVRAVNYGTDPNTLTIAGAVSVAATSVTHVQITGPVTAQVANSAFNTLEIIDGSNFTTTAGATFSVNGILKIGFNGDATLTSGFLQPNPGVGELVVGTFDSSNFDVNPLTINSTIQDNGSTPTTLTKIGSGGLYLEGSSVNTFTGPTFVNNGTLVLFKPQGTLAIGGPLFIGTGGESAINNHTATVKLLDSFQLNFSGGTPVTIRSDGALDLNGLSENVGPLTLQGGAVENLGPATGMLTLFGGVTTLASNTTATISGFQASVSNNILNSFTVALGTTPSGIDLDVSIPIMGGFTRISKAGPGVMRLSGDNNAYTAGVTLEAGTLLIAHDNALGTGIFIVNGGTFAADGAARTVGNAIVLNAAIPINGSFDLRLTGPIDGPGTLIKNGPSTLTLSGNNTFTGPLTVNDGTLAMSGGSLYADLVNQGTFVYTGGTFKGRLINGGTAAINADFAAANGLENDGYASVAAGRTITLNGAGLDNEGTLAMTAGSLKLGAGSGHVNRGSLNVPAGVVVNLASGATLTNTGGLNLSGGQFTGSTGTLVNAAGGTVSGTGTIASHLNNSGGLLAVTGGTLTVTQSFSNVGEIQLSAINATLSGGAITNTGTINGFGNLGSAVINSAGGLVEALGGVLFVGGALQNQAGGLLAAESGNKLVVSQGLATNVGIVNLTGGTFDNNGHPLNNIGQLSGWGVFRTGGTGIDNNGSITFSGGTTTVNGPVTNEGGKTITVAQNNAIFTGMVTNNMNATFTTVNATATFAGGFTNNGSSNFAKAGDGVVEIDTAPTLNNASTLSVTTGTLRFKVVSGSPTIGTGVGATVSSGATLELAGTVSALANGSHRVDIVNESAAPGILVSGTHQQVGNIDGLGVTKVNAGSDLTANRIVQGALVIGGTATSAGFVTIAASDASGNPLAQSFVGSNGPDSLRSTEVAEAIPFGVENPAAALSEGDPLLGNLGSSVIPGNAAIAVPEPSALALALSSLAIIFGVRRFGALGALSRIRSSPA